MSNVGDILAKASARLSGRDIESQEQESTWTSMSTYVGGFFDNNQTRDEPVSFFDGLFTLSRQQRMYGFAMMLVMGLVCLVIACFMLPYILFTARKFAFMYTVGNLCLISSTMFLQGPSQQLKTMFNSDRWIPSTVWIVSMVLTFVCAVQIGNIVLTMMLIFVQVVAMGWYILTYIPFGTRILGMFYSTVRSFI